MVQVVWMNICQKTIRKNMENYFSEFLIRLKMSFHSNSKCGWRGANALKLSFLISYERISEKHKHVRILTF